MTNRYLLVFGFHPCAGASLRTFAQASDVIRLQPFLTGLSSPLYVTNASDGTNRIFVLQQGGIIKVVQPGSHNGDRFY